MEGDGDLKYWRRELANNPNIYTLFIMTVHRKSFDELVEAKESLERKLVAFFDNIDEPMFDPHEDFMEVYEHGDEKGHINNCNSLDCGCIMGSFRRICIIKFLIGNKINYNV